MSTDEEEDINYYGEDPFTIVIDNGSSIIKAGFAGADAPKAVFPSVVI